MQPLNNHPKPNCRTASLGWAVTGFTPTPKKAPLFKAGMKWELENHFPESPVLQNGVWGFTLVEIMIVVAIVVVLLTIAVPGLLRSRVIGNETVALSGCRTINNACQLYHVNKESYPRDLPSLTEPESNPPYIDTKLAAGRKQGYEFIYELVDLDHFTLHVNPLHTGLLKGRYFYMDESGIIRARSGGSAGPDDEVVK